MLFGEITAIAWLAIRLGMLLGGYLLERLGLPAVLIGMATCHLATTVSMLFIPALREMDRTPIRQPASAVGEPDDA